MTPRMVIGGVATLLAAVLVASSLAIDQLHRAMRGRLAELGHEAHRDTAGAAP